MKLWHFTITEHNGEQEYTFDHLLYAETQGQATAEIRDWCKKWYDDDTVENLGPDCWSFFSGQILLDLDHISETTEQEWKDQMFERKLVGARPEKTQSAREDFAAAWFIFDNWIRAELANWEECATEAGEIEELKYMKEAHKTICETIEENIKV
jgi:hypothetical protein